MLNNEKQKLFNINFSVTYFFFYIMKKNSQSYKDNEPKNAQSVSTLEPKEIKIDPNIYKIFLWLFLSSISRQEVDLVKNVFKMNITSNLCLSVCSSVFLYFCLSKSLSECLYVMNKGSVRKIFKM